MSTKISYSLALKNRSSIWLVKVQLVPPNRLHLLLQSWWLAVKITSGVPHGQVGYVDRRRRCYSTKSRHSLNTYDRWTFQAIERAVVIVKSSKAIQHGWSTHATAELGWPTWLNEPHERWSFSFLFVWKIIGPHSDMSTFMHPCLKTKGCDTNAWMDALHTSYLTFLVCFCCRK